MQFALNGLRQRKAAPSLLVTPLVLAVLFGTPSFARAGDTAYINQVSANVRAMNSLDAAVPLRITFPAVSVPAASHRPIPYYLSMNTLQRNVAQTLEIGSYNQVLQVQLGINDYSAVGILGGNSNNVGVLQAGNNLRSNLLLLNTNSMAVGVIQPQGSAPVNMLIARLPNGALLIKR